MAEFAIVLPLLLVLFFAFYEAGRLFWNYNVVASSARDAARFAARLPITCPTPGDLSGADRTRVQNLARTGVISGGSPLLPGWTSDSSVNVVVTCVSNSGGTYQGRYYGMASVPTIKVTASAPYRILFASVLPRASLTSVATANAQAWTQ